MYNMCSYKSVVSTHMYTDTDAHTDRHTDRQTDRQTDTHTHTNMHACTYAYTHMRIHTYCMHQDRQLCVSGQERHMAHKCVIYATNFSLS